MGRRSGFSKALRLFCFVLQLNLISGSFPSLAADAQASTQWVEPYLALPEGASVEVKSLEARMIELSILDCASSSSRMKSRLQCLGSGIRAYCAQEKKISNPHCLAWGDLFVSAYSSGNLILNAQDQWRLRQARRARNVRTNQALLQEIFRRHAQEIKNLYDLTAPPCKPALKDTPGTQCEAERLSRFCIEYNRLRGLPPQSCVGLVLLARNKGPR